MSEIRVAFNASTSSGVINYKLYWGPPGGPAGLYTASGSPKSLGLLLQGGFDIDETGVRHIAATASNSSLESAFSTELVGTCVLGCVTGRAN